MTRNLKQKMRKVKQTQRKLIKEDYESRALRVTLLVCDCFMISLLVKVKTCFSYGIISFLSIMN